jgi:hypothetical protein
MTSFVDFSVMTISKTRRYSSPDKHASASRPSKRAVHLTRWPKTTTGDIRCSTGKKVVPEEERWYIARHREE